MGFAMHLERFSKMADAWLDKHLIVADVPEKRLLEAMRYSVLAGGKRIRPVLALAVCEMLDGDMDEILPFGCAIEMIHTYSLIHDDLPAMDNDDYRRGRLTNHKVFGEAIAILAGDALLNRAFEIMISESEKAEQPRLALRASAIIGQASGVEGMVAGQTVDLACEGKEIPLEMLQHMHRQKTGAMLMASVLSSAVLCGATPDQYAALSLYSGHIGMAFQIKDDILDVESTTEVLGKPAGSDLRNNKSTFVSLLGLDGARQALRECTEGALEALSPFGERADFLCDLARYIANRDK